uniref:Uncharacterized protein n=1 Tax=Grammatophora oceanica TaxID=210454 RepID=A0A7S1YD19_9STRA
MSNTVDSKPDLSPKSHQLQQPAVAASQGAGEGASGDAVASGKGDGDTADNAAANSIITSTAAPGGVPATSNNNKHGGGLTSVGVGSDELWNNDMVEDEELFGFLMNP